MFASWPRELLRFVLPALAALGGLTLLYVATLCAAALVDKDRVRDALRLAADIGVVQSKNQGVDAYGRAVDHFSECVALGGSALAPRIEGSLLQHVLLHPVVTTASGDKTDPCGALRLYVAGDGTATGRFAYLHYWHGQSALIAVGLGIGGSLVLLHKLSLLALVAAVVCLLWQWSRHAPVEGALILVVGYLLCTDAVHVPQLLSHAVGQILAFSSAAIACALAGRGTAGESALWWLALLSGSMYAFVDFLTNPPLTPALMAFAILACSARSGINVPTRTGHPWPAAIAVQVVIIWFASYAITWTGKWLVTALVVSPEFVAEQVFPQIIHRLKGGLDREMGDGQLSASFGVATLQNLRQVGFMSALTVAGLLAAVFCVRRRPGAPDARLFVGRFALLAWPAAIPLVWVEVVRNHSIVHAWFTYRSLAMSLCIVAAAALLALLPPREPLLR